MLTSDVKMVVLEPAVAPVVVVVVIKVVAIEVEVGETVVNVEVVAGV